MWWWERGEEEDFLLFFLKGRRWEIKHFVTHSTVMGFPWIDVTMWPNERREYGGSHWSQRLIWPCVNECDCTCVSVSKCVTLCDMFMCPYLGSWMPRMHYDGRGCIWLWDRTTERVRRSCADMNKGSGYTSEPPPVWLHPFFTLSPPTNVCLPPSLLLPFLPCLHFFPPVFFSTTPSSPFIPMWCKAEVNERRWQSRIESPSFVSDKKSLRVWGCRKRPFSYSP